MSEQTSKDIQLLAAEVLELSKTNQPSDGHLGLGPELLIKAKELVSAIESPMDHAMSMTWPLVQGSAIRTFMHLGGLQAIPPSGSITLTELASATSAQASLLQRILRVLVSAGFITRNSDGSYAHTSLSLAYDPNNLGAIFRTIFDEVAVLTSLPAYLSTHGASEPDGEKATTHNPNTWYHGQEGKTVFEIMQHDKDKLQGFQKLMAMAARFRPFTGFYDFGKLKSTPSGDDEEIGRPVLVDVGGADGTTLVKILEAHPDIKPTQCVLEDLPHAINLAQQNPNLPNGVIFQPHDFFQFQPIQNAKAYLLRAVCHDWSDTMVIKMLSHIVSAMGKDSKVLIADNVLPEGGVQGISAYMDLMMLCIGGKERTKADFERVLEAAGLKLDRIWPAGKGTEFAIVEASLK